MKVRITVHINVQVNNKSKFRNNFDSFEIYMNGQYMIPTYLTMTLVLLIIVICFTFCLEEEYEEIVYLSKQFISK